MQTQQPNLFRAIIGMIHWMVKVADFFVCFWSLDFSLNDEPKRESSKKTWFRTVWSWCHIKSCQYCRGICWEIQRNSLNCPTSTKKDWKGFSGCKMGPSRLVPKESATACCLLYWLNRARLGKLLHPPYSLDHAPYYHLFRWLLNHLDSLRLTSREEIVSFFRSKLKNFTSVASISLLTDGMRFYEVMTVILMIKYFYV